MDIMKAEFLAVREAWRAVFKQIPGLKKKKKLSQLWVLADWTHGTPLWSDMNMNKSKEKVGSQKILLPSNITTQSLTALQWPLTRKQIAPTT